VTFLSWRGTVGLIKPTHRPGALEETIRLLPEGVGVIPLTVGIRRGDADEFHAVLETMGQLVDEIAGIGADLVMPMGAPPFMLLGHRAERELIASWEEKHGLPVITAGVSQTEAMRALGGTRMIGLTYFQGPMNDTFGQYFTDAGFDVVAMQGMDVPFDRVHLIASHEVYAIVRQLARQHRDADVIYILGAGMRILDIIEMLEEDLGMPVVQSVTARVWSIQQALSIGRRLPGYGRLLAELPAPVVR
jgi:maleate isomerase